MKHTQKLLKAGLFSFSLIALLGSNFGSNSGLRAATKIIKIDGSSTVYPITEAVAEEFQKLKKIQVTVGISGTGGGFKKFCESKAAVQTDIQNASRPISTEEMAKCKANSVSYFELPVAFDAISVVVNPKNTWLSEITIEDLKKIWEPSAQGKVTKWNQVRKEWPNVEIKLFGAGSDSGTFDYFTEAVNGKAKASRGDYTASEDDNSLVQGIANNENALGYIPHSYYEQNKKDAKGNGKLKALGIISNHEKAPLKGKAVLPTDEAVVAGSYFPLSRPVFIYINATSAQKPEVKAFIEFFLDNALKLVKEAKYVPLTADSYQLGLNNFRQGKLGTAFGGKSEVGIKIQDLLKREGQL